MTPPIRLDGRRTSYIIDIAGAGLPRALHWGRRLPADLDLGGLPALRARPRPGASLDRDVPASLLPGLGLGWFGTPGLAGNRPGSHTAWTSDFAITAVEHVPGGIIVRGRDAVAGLGVELHIVLDPGTDVLMRRTVLINEGNTAYQLAWCAAGVFTVPAACSQALVFAGQWAQEFQEHRVDLGPGTWSRESRRGRTSHDAFPGLLVGTAGFGEDHGEVYGFHLAWSGNHRLLVEPLDDGGRCVQLGEWLAPGEVVLAPGARYHSPPVHAVFSAAGANRLAQAFHGFVRERVLSWPGAAMRPRPVHLNTWEALYFDHRPEALEALARAAAALGVERFVLDDGWFHGRRDDTRALGDWTVDPVKYPRGLGPLADLVRGLGMELGLWVEPEMVSPDSELYRAHPEWALQIAGRPLLTGRNQLVLDLTRAEIADHVFAAIDRLLRAHPIAYLKWDHNRDLTAAGDARGRPAYRDQTLAFYALVDRVRATHPRVEIESCASGGGRADHGVLARAHRIWTSDSNDALARQAIQRGFARFFPPEVMGAHIGPSPAHLSGRRHTLAFRAATALFGHLGLELDVRALDHAERAALADWIALYKRHRALLHGGRAWHLDRQEPGRTAHGVVAPDGAAALFAVVQHAPAPARRPAPVRLPGLAPAATYRLSVAGPVPPGVAFASDTPAAPDDDALAALAAGTLHASGAVLATLGLATPILPPETALLLHLQRVDRAGPLTPE